MKYVLDTNFFIEAHRVTYPLDVATGFWAKVSELSHKGVLESIDKVRDEIYGNNDDLEVWCKSNLSPNFFFDSSPSISEYAQVINWSQRRVPPYLPAALNDFADSTRADAWLIAHALRNKHILVTQEISSPQKTSIVKIPDACIALKIDFMKTIDMFRDMGTTF